MCQNSLPKILIIQQRMALTSSLADKDFILTLIHLMGVRHGTLDPSTHYLTTSVAAAASPSPSSSPPFPLSHFSPSPPPPSCPLPPFIK